MRPTVQAPLPCACPPPHAQILLLPPSWSCYPPLLSPRFLSWKHGSENVHLWHRLNTAHDNPAIVPRQPAYREAIELAVAPVVPLKAAFTRLRWLRVSHVPGHVGHHEYSNEHPRFHLCPVVCARARSRAASGPGGHPRGVLCPSGVRPGLLRAVVKTPIRSETAEPLPGAIALGRRHGSR